MALFPEAERCRLLRMICTQAPRVLPLSSLVPPLALVAAGEACGLNPGVAVSRSVAESRLTIDKGGREGLHYRWGALLASLVLLIGLPWVGTTLGPNPVAVTGVVSLALLTFFASSSLLRTVDERLLRAREGVSGPLSASLRVSVAAAARSALPLVNAGVVLASCAFLVSFVGVVVAALDRPPIALLDPVVAVFGAAGVLVAVWTHDRVNRAAELARATELDALLLRLRLYLLAMTSLTVFAALVSVASALAWLRTDLTDFGAAMAGGLAWAYSLDVREWANRAVSMLLADAED